MYVNYMTKTYHNFLKSYEADHKKRETVSFAEKIDQKSQELSGAGETNGIMDVDIVSDGEMTLEEYKQYIYDKIANIPVSPSQMSSSFSVHISEEGFQAMKEDPDYEKWVLDTLKYDFGFDNPWAGIAGGSYVVHNFGATKEEYSGQSWYAGYQNGKGGSLFHQRAENSFWERRVERRKQLQEQFEELQQKRALDKRLLGDDYVQQNYFSAELLFQGAGTESEKKNVK
ncbi:MAG: hypothetical protein HFH41_11575 [Lachnospiraceae bacterium]|nr:hypothetical protein [Lachnospiraceae bacterium]